MAVTDEPNKLGVKTMVMQQWTDGSGRLSLTLSPADAESGYHSGDCEEDVRALYELPHVAAQANAWGVEDLVAHLLEYGAWEEAELWEDEDMLRMRTLWLACADMVDNNQGDEDDALFE